MKIESNAGKTFLILPQFIQISKKMVPNWRQSDVVSSYKRIKMKRRINSKLGMTYVFRVHTFLNKFFVELILLSDPKYNGMIKFGLKFAFLSSWPDFDTFWNFLLWWTPSFLTWGSHLFFVVCNAIWRLGWVL